MSNIDTGTENSEMVSIIDTKRQDENPETTETPNATEYTTPAQVEPEEPETTPEPTETPSDDQNGETSVEYVLSDEELDGISDAWVKQGEYYYYTKPMKNV